MNKHVFSKQARAVIFPVVGMTFLLAAGLAGTSAAQQPEPSQPAETPATVDPSTTVGAQEPATAEDGEASEAASTVPVGPQDADADGAEGDDNGSLASIPTLDDVTSSGREIVDGFLVPLWNRFVNALPSALRAIGLLILFWIIGLVAGTVVTRLLKATSLDNRLAQDLGMEKTVQGWEKRGTSLEKMVGTAVKWIILIFGFVAFFDALNLGMVASPLASILDNLVSAFSNLLRAFAYLAAYWAVGTVLKLAITKGLTALSFDDRAGRFFKPRDVKGELIGPSAMVGRLVFYVVMLFSLPPFLEALDQQAAVAPLRDMMTKVFAFLPNAVAALVLVFVGRVVATIVREVVSNFLAASGADGMAERFGLGAATGSKKLSDIVGSLAYFFTFIPIIVAAVDSLGITAISEPVKSTLEQLLAAIPLIFLAILVVGIGYVVARTVRSLVESFLQTVGFDALPSRVGLQFLIPKEGQTTLSSIAGAFVMIVILLLSTQQALETLQLTELSELFGGLLSYLPQLLVGLAIILAALSLGTYVAGLLSSLLGESMQGRVAANVARWAIFFLGFSMGLNQLGVAEEIITVAVSAVLGAVALALGLAFGLGGRDRAKALLEEKT